LDEVFLKINGRLHYLWRAVDQDGDVLDIMVQSRRDKKKAAKKFFRKLLKGLRYVPRVIVTDKLRSYSVARTEVMPSVEHVQQKYQSRITGRRIHINRLDCARRLCADSSRLPHTSEWDDICTELALTEH
jgi:transposase-like protein